MKSIGTWLLIFTVSCALLAQQCGAQTNVTGVIVDQDGKPIPGVRCGVFGFPQPSGGHIWYTGLTAFVFSDMYGKFSIPVPRADPMVDILFDEEAAKFNIVSGVPIRIPPATHAPAFLYRVVPASGPLRVVLPDGKLLRGRVVERVNGELRPIAAAEVNLDMPQAFFMYQAKRTTDSNGEFEFRISEPPRDHRWFLYHAGETLPIDYAQITPQTLMVLGTNTKSTMDIELNDSTNGATSSH